MENSVQDPKTEENKEQIVTQEKANDKTTEESQDQINWRQFREAREKERREKEAAERIAKQREQEIAALKEALSSVVNKEDTTQESESEEQRIRKEVEKYIAEQKRKDEEERQKKESQELPQKLSQAYSDFNTVCSSENLDYLEYHYPEIVAAFKYMPNNFEKWTAVYKAAKRFLPNLNTAQEKQRIENNLNKPQSISSAGASRTGDNAPNLLTDQKKQANWLRMQQVIRGG